MKLTHLIEKNQDNQHHEDFALDVVAGLNAQPKSISAKYFYDDTGSELFQKISQHPDYYLTKTEFSILQHIAAKLPMIITDEEIDIIELGVGDGHKSRLVINGFLDQGRQVNFYPIDISEKAMHLLGEHLSATDNLKIHGVIADYFQGLNYLKKISSNKKLVLFLGSNIGNLTKEQSQHFLHNLQSSLNTGDYTLIGFDLIKESQILNKAYNDSNGLTKAFNLNLLTRINRELDGNFDVSKFQHYGFYNPTQGTMESYLISLVNQDVTIATTNKTFHFDQFEAMHLEYSHKFTTDDIADLAHHTGFEITQHFSDEKSYFSDALWHVKGKQ